MIILLMSDPLCCQGPVIFLLTIDPQSSAKHLEQRGSQEAETVEFSQN